MLSYFWSKKNQIFMVVTTVIVTGSSLPHLTIVHNEWPSLWLILSLSKSEFMKHPRQKDVVSLHHYSLTLKYKKQDILPLTTLIP